MKVSDMIIKMSADAEGISQGFQKANSSLDQFINKIKTPQVMKLSVVTSFTSVGSSVASAKIGQVMYDNASATEEATTAVDKYNKALSKDLAGAYDKISSQASVQMNTMSGISMAIFKESANATAEYSIYMEDLIQRNADSWFSFAESVGTAVGWITKSVLTVGATLSWLLESATIILGDLWDTWQETWTEMKKPITALYDWAVDKLGWILDAVKWVLEAVSITGEGTANALTDKAKERLKTALAAYKEGVGKIWEPSTFKPERAPKVDKKYEDELRRMYTELAKIGEDADEIARLNHLFAAGVAEINMSTGAVKINNEAHEKTISLLSERIQSEKLLVAIQEANAGRIKQWEAQAVSSKGELINELKDLEENYKQNNITLRVYEANVNRVNAAIRQIDLAPKLAELEAMRSAIEMRKTQGTMSALDAAKQEAQIVAEIVRLKKEDMASMPSGPDLSPKDRRAVAEAQNELNKKMEEYIRLQGIIADYEDVWGGMVKGIQTYADSVSQYGKQMENSVVSSFKAMETALVDFLDTGTFEWKKFGKAILHELNQIIAKQMMSAMIGSGGQSGGGGLLGGLIGAGIKGLAGMVGGFALGDTEWTPSGMMIETLKNAKGNAFSNGRLMRFGSGAVFNSPKVFPMANGGIGMLGEAGPEAVMPLERTADGKLGVKGDGGSGGVNITIVAADSQSFADMCRRNPNAIVGPVSQALKANQDLRYQIKKSMR